MRLDAQNSLIISSRLTAHLLITRLCRSEKAFKEVQGLDVSKPTNRYLRRPDADADVRRSWSKTKGGPGLLSEDLRRAQGISEARVRMSRRSAGMGRKNPQAARPARRTARHREAVGNLQRCDMVAS